MSESCSLCHLDRLDDQLAHEYGDDAPLIKAAIHWCITGDTADGFDEWEDLDDICRALDIAGLTDLSGKVEASMPRHIRVRPWWRLSRFRCLAVIDILLGNHGIKTVAYGDQWDRDSPQFTYSNNGDSYATTIGYDSEGDWCVCGWADWIEEQVATESF